MEDTTPGQPSLGQIGYEAALAYLEVPEERRVDFDILSERDRNAWSAAATAIVVEYDTRLFQKAEDQAVAAGLDPQPLPGITPPANA